MSKIILHCDIHQSVLYYTVLFVHFFYTSLYCLLQEECDVSTRGQVGRCLARRQLGKRKLGGNPEKTNFHFLSFLMSSLLEMVFFFNFISIPFTAHCESQPDTTMVFIGEKLA